MTAIDMLISQVWLSLEKYLSIPITFNVAEHKKSTLPLKKRPTEILYFQAPNARCSHAIIYIWSFLSPLFHASEIDLLKN